MTDRRARAATSTIAPTLPCSPENLRAIVDDYIREYHIRA